MVIIITKYTIERKTFELTKIGKIFNNNYTFFHSTPVYCQPPYNSCLMPNRVKNHNELGSWVNVLESYSLPSIVTDGTEKIILINRSAERLFNVSNDELAGKSISCLKSDSEDYAEEEKRRSELLIEGYYHGLQTILVKSKKEYLCQVTVNAITDNSDSHWFMFQFIIDRNAQIFDYRDFVRVKNEMYSHMGDIHDLNILAARLRLDYRQILYLFKKFAGQTPKQYLKKLRIKRCLVLLQNNNYSLKEIAYELGYCDLSHLCNSFKEEMNRTLIEYRNNL